MTDNYKKIVQDNLKTLYDSLPEILERRMAAIRDGNRFLFQAFGEPCVISPDRITLGEKTAPSILGILISLYALHASTDICVSTPFKAFKEFENSMPYAGAFATHTEQVLVPYVPDITRRLDLIHGTLRGEPSPPGTGGDASFVVYPLPKSRCAIFCMNRTTISRHRSPACIPAMPTSLCPWTGWRMWENTPQKKSSN